jgi:hypothetical protein
MTDFCCRAADERSVEWNPRASLSGWNIDTSTELVDGPPKVQRIESLFRRQVGELQRKGLVHWSEEGRRWLLLAPEPVAMVNPL